MVHKCNHQVAGLKVQDRHRLTLSQTYIRRHKWLHVGQTRQSLEHQAEKPWRTTGKPTGLELLGCVHLSLESGLLWPSELTRVTIFQLPVLKTLLGTILLYKQMPPLFLTSNPRALAPSPVRSGNQRKGSLDLAELQGGSKAESWLAFFCGCFEMSLTCSGWL